jgi:hypothetical protein
VEVATDLRAPLINRAELRRTVERHTCAIAPLVHATHATVLDNELLWNVIKDRVEFDDEMAALATAGAGGKIVGKERHSMLTIRT